MYTLRHAARAALLLAACLPLAAAATPAGQSYTAGPLGAAGGPIACDWQDNLNPPGAGGGGY